MQEYDLIVIGGGSGLDVANAAAQKGLKVAIIEKDKIGGTCLNRGCIPSKLLIHSADIVETIRRSNLFGINVENFSIDYQKIIDRVSKITDSDSESIKNSLLESKNPKLFTQKCRFIGYKKIILEDKDTVHNNNNNNISNKNENNSQILSSEKFIIAAGNRPHIPDIKGLDESGFITSDTALRLKKQPDILTFIGGGYIACELAHFFGSLGTKINIIQRNNFLIPTEDREISNKFTEIFEKKYNLYLGFDVKSVLSDKKEDNHAAVDKNKKFVTIGKNNSGNSIEIESDQLIVSAGRKPNTDLLHLDKTGVEVNKKGFIVVNEYLETTTNGIFALGDIVGRYQFKHNANLEMQYVYNNILNSDHKKIVDYTAMPHAIFSSPQIAGVGFTEQELEKMNKPFKKSKYEYINTGMGEAIEEKNGFVKFLIDSKNRKILGCHIIGTDASTLIHEVLVSMRTGNGTIDNIVKTIHIHPALSEVVARAASQI